MELYEAIKKRRSIRKFSSVSVFKEVIEKLVEAASWAPYACECWKFVAVGSLDGKKRLAKAAGQSWIATAPYIIVVGADITGRSERHKTLYCIQDTAAAIQNLMLAATAEKLGTCWIGSFNDDEARKVVNFPKEIQVVAMIPVGHPAESPTSTRKGLKEILWWENYS